MTEVLGNFSVSDLQVFYSIKILTSGRLRFHPVERQRGGTAVLRGAVRCCAPAAVRCGAVRWWRGHAVGSAMAGRGGQGWARVSSFEYGHSYVYVWWGWTSSPCSTGIRTIKQSLIQMTLEQVTWLQSGSIVFLFCSLSPERRSPLPSAGYRKNSSSSLSSSIFLTTDTVLHFPFNHCVSQTTSPSSCKPGFPRSYPLFPRLLPTAKKASIGMRHEWESEVLPRGCHAAWCWCGRWPSPVIRWDLKEISTLCRQLFFFSFLWQPPRIFLTLFFHILCVRLFVCRRLNYSLEKLKLLIESWEQDVTRTERDGSCCHTAVSGCWLSAAQLPIPDKSDHALFCLFLSSLF